MTMFGFSAAPAATLRPHAARMVAIFSGPLLLICSCTGGLCVPTRGGAAGAGALPPVRPP